MTNCWKPAKTDEVVSLFERELDSLDAEDRALISAARIDPRRVPIDSREPETVVVIAEFGRRLLYWEDVDDGWELEERSETGGVPGRYASQFNLTQIAYQLRQSPPASS